MAKIKRKEFEIDLEPLFEAVGMNRVIDTIGLDRVINRIGIRRVIDAKGVDWVLKQMTPEQRRQFKERLK